MLRVTRTKLTCWQWGWTGTETGSRTRVLFIVFLFLNFCLDDKHGVSIHLKNKSTGFSLLIILLILSTYQISAYHIWSCFWVWHFSPSTVINEAVYWCFWSWCEKAETSSETKQWGERQYGHRTTDSDRTRAISSATLMKGFHQFLHEEQLEPDIKTHRMSFIVYCI